MKINGSANLANFSQRKTIENYLFFIVLDVTNVGDNGLKYWCEWEQNKGKFVDSAECIESWPHLVQTFLESKLIQMEQSESCPIGIGIREYIMKLNIYIK